MDPQKSNMTVLAQIVKQIPAKIIDSLAKKFRIQTRAFSPTSHVVTLLYEHLAHSLSLNDVCDSLQHHAGILSQIRRCTHPTRNGLSYANRTRNADMAEELFWYVYNDLKSSYPAFFTSSRSYPVRQPRIVRDALADPQFASPFGALAHHVLWDRQQIKNIIGHISAFYSRISHL